MIELLYELVKVSIGTRNSLSRIPTEEEWRCLFNLSKKQSIVGICFAGLQLLGADADEGYANIGMSEDLYLAWMSVAAHIQHKNDVVNRQCCELQSTLSEAGLKSCVLKGQGIAQLYDEPLRVLRQSGDIDIWVDGSWNYIMNYANEQSPTREFDRKHTHLKVFEDTSVELHWRPVVSANPFLNRKLSVYFDKERERQFANRTHFKNRTDVCVPTADFQFVHSVLHLYMHFLYEGVGIRQMLDLYYAQKSIEGMRTEVMSTLKWFGLVRFVRAVQYVLNVIFGVSEPDLLCGADPQAGNVLLNDVLTGGNFGHHNKSNLVKDESFSHRMLRRYKRRLHLMRFDPMGMIFTPLSKIRNMVWKKKVIKRYNL